MCCKSILLMFPGLSGAFLGLYEGIVRVPGVGGGRLARARANQSNAACAQRALFGCMRYDTNHSLKHSSWRA